MAPQANASVRCRRAFTAAGEELNHAIDRIRAINGTRRAAQHFDAINLSQWNALPSHTAAARLRVQTHAIQVHRRVLRIAAAQVDAGRAANTTVATYLQAGLAGQHISHT